MKLVSWNVNSIKARGEHVQRFLKETAPDVLMLQELKGLDFPGETFEGYHAEAVTQKSYNGVALLSRAPMEVLHTALPGDDSDDQARYIEADINGIRVINIYLPNGNPVTPPPSSRAKPRDLITQGDPSTTFADAHSAQDDIYDIKFLYKLRWMERLIARITDLRANKIPFVIGGDFNIIPQAIDCHDIKVWQGDALHHPESLKRWRTLLNLGLTDAFRIFNHAAQQYTFWDYQAGAWPKNNGIRIDHFLTSPQITDRIESCAIDKNPRGWDRPSDHTPIALTLKAV